ncbi:hypothetical protein CC79DRAFT_1347778 [Sarocladium strictum]
MDDSQLKTRSHVLATTGVINKAATSRGRAGELCDLGWNNNADVDQHPWITGVDNEDVWVLMRRMDKQVFEIQRADHVPQGELDMGISEDLLCSPNKLRAEVERMYMGIILGMLSFAKTIARLRSWHEPRRTGLFCVYFTAWKLDYLLFVIFCTSIALIKSLRVRRLLFPPAPLSMINTTDGGVEKPMAGTLGSIDTATGAPQNLRGESVENEASNFVTSFAAIVANLVTGQDPHGAPYDAAAGDSGGVIPHVSAGTMAVAKDKAEGVNRPAEDKTKTPMEETISSYTTPMLLQMITMSNVWERFAKSVHACTAVGNSSDRPSILTPTPPFDHEKHQLRLAYYILPLALASLFLTRDFLVRSFTFALGVALFGRPLLVEAQAQIMESVPNNPQLAMTLLRLGEVNKAPLPPPLVVHHTPPDEAIELDDTNLDGSLGDKPLGMTSEDLQDLANHDKEMADEAGGANNELEQAGGHSQKRQKVFNVLKEGARGAVKVVAAADKLRGLAGAPHSKLRAGVLASSRDQVKKLGPVEFSGRYHGTKGYMYVDSMADEPFVAFNKRSIDKVDEGDSDDENGLRTLWKVKIADILKMKKHSGYGLKTKLGAGWAVNGGVQDGLRIVDVEGKEHVVTALPHRDALFNRLCAISQIVMWEIC